MKKVLIVANVMITYVYTPVALMLSRFSSSRIVCVLVLMIPFLLLQGIRWQYNLAHPDAPLSKRDTRFEQAIDDHAFVSFTAIFSLLFIAELIIG